MLNKIALEASVPLQLALTAHQLLRRRVGVSIPGALQLLDISHRRRSPCNASVALEFGDIHSLAAAAFVTSELPPERGLDVAPKQQHPQQPGPGPPPPVRA